MSNEYTVEQVRDAASSVSSAWCKRDPLVRAPRCLKAADMLRAYAALLERQAQWPSELKELSDEMEACWICASGGDGEITLETINNWAGRLTTLATLQAVAPVQASAVPDGIDLTAIREVIAYINMEAQACLATGEPNDWQWGSRMKSAWADKLARAIGDKP